MTTIRPVRVNIQVGAVLKCFPMPVKRYDFNTVSLEVNIYAPTSDFRLQEKVGKALDLLRSCQLSL